MSLDSFEDYKKFRKEVREFVDEKLPDSIRTKVRLGQHLKREDYVNWYKILNDRGWATPNWPKEWGGLEWSPIKKHIFDEELMLGGAPRMVSSGIMMLAPVLIKFGNESQRRKYLPDIKESNVWWTQGFSEPGSGSDLASLKTTAIRSGDNYIVNGQKVWTSYASTSEMMFCLAKTDPNATKPQEGISFLLINMDSPGVTVRPIKTLDGGTDLNEVFLDNVNVPLENLVGEENKGWTYAKYLLSHERGGIAGIGAAKYQLGRLKRLASLVESEGRQLIDDPVFLSKVSRLEIDLIALEATSLRLAAENQVPIIPGAETSMLKVKGTELRQDIFRLLLEVAGEYGDFWNDDWQDNLETELKSLVPNYLDARKLSIYGGTNEIQRNLISKKIIEF